MYNTLTDNISEKEENDMDMYLGINIDVYVPKVVRPSLMRKIDLLKEELQKEFTEKGGHIITLIKEENEHIDKSDLSKMATLSSCNVYISMK